MEQCLCSVWMDACVCVVVRTKQCVWTEKCAVWCVYCVHVCMVMTELLCCVCRQKIVYGVCVG